MAVCMKYVRQIQQGVKTWISRSLLLVPNDELIVVGKINLIAVDFWNSKPSIYFYIFYTFFIRFLYLCIWQSVIKSVYIKYIVYIIHNKLKCKYPLKWLCRFTEATWIEKRVKMTIFLSKLPPKTPFSLDIMVILDSYKIYDLY